MKKIKKFLFFPVLKVILKIEFFSVSGGFVPPQNQISNTKFDFD